jgi:hypothetical protein
MVAAVERMVIMERVMEVTVTVIKERQFEEGKLIVLNNADSM